MKKCLKIILILIVILIGLILLDTLQAIIFNNSPVISKKEYYDYDNWIAKGIILNSYHCIDENNNLTMKYKLKNTKYMCPIKLNDFDLFVNVQGDTERKKIFVVNHNNTDYYFANTKFNVFLSQNGGDFDIKTALINEMVEFSDILEKSSSIEKSTIDDSAIYRFPGYLDIIVCDNNLDKKSVIFADPEINLDDIEYFCKS